MKITLTILELTDSKYPTQEIANIEWKDGICSFINGSEDIRTSFNENVEGLSEWISPTTGNGKGEDVEYRLTFSDDELFLPRLKAYYERQFDFLCILKVG